MKIFLGILAGISLIGNVMLSLVLKRVIKAFNQLYMLNSIILWIEGRDVDENIIKQIYEHVNLIVNFAPGENGNVVYDISEYENKNVIGLTYFMKECDNSQNGIMLDVTVCQFKNGVWVWRE